MYTDVVCDEKEIQQKELENADVLQDVNMYCGT